ncbi:MAG: glycosyltransferase family 4 protein [Candidatus Aminicenantes bacterium]|nr:glycosyltransferase family 4 protein [Candidatus Aminicenantes bacterium]
MNILFVTDVSIKKVLGGAERVLLEQTTRLSERGHEIHIITRKLPIHSSSYENIKNVHEWRYNINKKNSFLSLVSTILNCQKLFRQISQKITIDLINFHQPFSSFAINFLRKTQKIKKVYTCHSLAFEEYETRNPKPSKILPRISHKINSHLRRRIEKYSISKCNLIVVLSEFTKNKLVEHYKIKPEKIHIIPGGVDLSKFEFEENKLAIRKQLGLPGEKFILFTVRNLVPRMGLENLIYAMKEIIKYAKDIYLIIGGKGELREKLSSLISELNLIDFVKLQGFIPSEELPHYNQAADFFILPTKYLEGFGLVTVEAMACGTPVLGTPVGGTKEILNKFNPGFLFKDTNPESIADLILEKYKYYKDEHDEYKQLSRKCRVFVENNYPWKRNIEKTETLFAQLIKEK